METFKREPGTEVCRGCLSADRRLAPLANFDLFFSILNDREKWEALDSSAVYVCWECAAFLRKMNIFRTQVQRAHKLLAETAEELPIKGLSQLSVTHKQDFDVILKDNLEGTDEPLIFSMKEEENEVTIEEHNLDLNDDHNFGDDHFETVVSMDLDLKVETESEMEKIIDAPQMKQMLKTEKESKTNIKRKMKADTKESKPFRTGIRCSNRISLLNKKNSVIEKLATLIKGKIQKGKTKGITKGKIKRKYKKRKKSKSSTKAVKKLQKETIKEVEVEVDLQLEKIKGEEMIKDKIEIDNIDDTSSDEEDESKMLEIDPDFKFRCDNDKYKDTERGVQKRGLAVKNHCLYVKRLRMEEIIDVNEYFTKVDLSSEEIKEVLDNELSYKTETFPHSCIYCGRCFQLIRTLVRHKRNWHKQESRCQNPVYSMYRCNVCSKIVRSGHAEAHTKYLHRVQYICIECDKVFWDESEGVSHYKEVHKSGAVDCAECGKTVRSKNSLAKHIKMNHTEMTCDMCDKVCKSYRNLQYHKQRKHNTEESPPELRYCVTCDKQYPTVFLYDMHLRYTLVHKGEIQRVTCTDCGKVLRDKLSLKFHFERFHAAKTNFPCPHCNKYFSRKSGVQTHIEGVHLKVPKLKNKLCSFCGRGFTHSRTLIHHIRTHTGERPHACPHCPAAFAQPFPLRKHLATQHPEALAILSEAPTTQASGP